MSRILLRSSWSAKRKAIVIRRIDNEHGCTLSRSAEIETSGNIHVPPLLTLHSTSERPGLYFSTTIAASATATMPSVIRSRFILRGYVGFDLKLHRGTTWLREEDEAAAPAAPRRSMCIGVVHDGYLSRFASLDDFV